MGTVTANGIEFSYLELGDGPLALCLHGFPDHARSFRHQLPALAAAGYRAVAPYTRGYAPTQAPSPTVTPYYSAVQSQDAVALIEALGGGEPAVLIGHDWGAAAAYGAAQAAPEKISKLITIAVPHGGLFESLVTNPAQQRRSWYMYFFLTPLADAALAHDDFALVERLWRDWSPGWDFPADEMRLLKQTYSEPGVAAAALAYYRHSFAVGGLGPATLPPPSAGLEAFQAKLAASPEVKVPTLYIHGADDGCIGAEISEGMEAAFPKGLRRQILAGAGHFVHQEKPEEVNRLILDFLAE
jgi:pimeloyl-ACP methyl ester carboxylesterase